MLKFPGESQKPKVPTLNKSEAYKLFRQFMFEIQENNSSESIATGEVRLTPKLSSTSTAEGTIFYCSTDNGVYVGVE